MREQKHLTDRFLLLVSILMATALPFVGVPFAHADGLNSRYAKLASSLPSAATTYQVGFTPTVTGVPMGSFSLEVCANDPLPNTPCVAPGGFDASAVTLGAQTGETGFSIHPNSTANKVILTRPAAAPTGVAARYDLNNIINPNTVSTFYARLQTFTSTDGTGADIESAGLALATHGDFDVQVEVPPYLQLCAAVVITGNDCTTANSFFIDLGEFSTTAPVKASSHVLVATNAASGFSVTLNGTTLTSGNNTVSPMVPGASSNPGTSQFGLNLRANSNPSVGANPPGGMGVVSAPYNVPNTFRFQNGDVLISGNAPTDFALYTISYIANVNTGQPAGYYATTLTYICLANF